MTLRRLDKYVLRRGGIDLFGREEAAAALLELLNQGGNVALIGPRAAGKTVLFLQAVLLALEVTPLRKQGHRKRPSFYQFAGRLDELLSTSEGLSESAVVHVLCEHDDRLLSLCRIADWASDQGVQVVVELLPSQWSRLQTSFPSCAGRFIPFEVKEPQADQLFQILTEKLKRAEPGAEAELTPEVFGFLTDCANKCYPQLPEPAASLSFLNNILAYRAEKRIIGEAEPLSRGFLAKCASIYTGLPRFFFDQGELPSAEELSSWLSEDVLGQHTAANVVARRLVEALSDKERSSKPLASFLFVGGEGSGKTAMAEAIAKRVLGSSRKFFLFDLSSFERESVDAELFGSAGEPGLIGDALMMEPANLLCFDRIETASGKLLSKFARMVREGVVVCGGREFSLANTIVVFTLSESVAEVDELNSKARARQILGDSLVNSVDEVIQFKRLGKVELQLLVHKLIDDVSRREGLAERGLQLEVDDSVVSLIIDRSLEEERSARGIPKAVEENVLVPLSVGLSEGKFAEGQRLRLVVYDGQLKFEPVQEGEVPVSQTVELRLARLRGGSDAKRELEEAKERLPSMMKRLAELEQLCEQYSPVVREVGARGWDEEDETLDATSLNRIRIKEANRALKELFDVVDSALDTNNEFELKDALRQLLLFERQLDRLEIEVGYFDRWDFQDALLLIRPSEGEDLEWVDRLWRMYAAWAGKTGRAAELLYEPCERGETEPMLLVRLRGAFSFGYLKWESGVHRLMSNGSTKIAKINVFPYLAGSWGAFGKATAFVRYTKLAALKARSPRLGRIRSLVQAYHPATGEDVILQNMLTINENKQIAREILGGIALWRRSKAAIPSPVALMRLYDADADAVRDQLTETETSFERAMAGSIDALLMERIRLLSPKREPIKPPEAG